MKTLYLILLLIWLGTVCPGASSEDGRNARPKSVERYCEDFARKYAENTTAGYQARTAQVEKVAGVWTVVNNIFHPKGQRFTAGYHCRFETAVAGATPAGFLVRLYLTETLAFARHTKDDEYQIIPIEFVVDTASGKSGYGVFKFLDRQ